MEGPRLKLPKYFTVLLGIAVLLKPNGVSADIVAARHKEGPSHGLLVVRTLDGKTIATGDLIQTAKSGRIVSRLVFHFKDGSIQDETTEFTQKDKFQLLSDHMTQKGPSFKLQLETSLNAATGEFTARYQDKDGKEKDLSKHLSLPPDVYNGLMWTILKNLDASTPTTTVSMVSGSPKPRLVKLHIVQEGQEPFSIGGRERKATHFVIKVEITGAAGVVAPLVGKKPPDTQTWILGGEVPTFLKSEGPFYDGGPIWRVEPTGPAGPRATSKPAKQ